jgi:hypothetical protein
MNEHTAALQQQLDAALSAISSAAQESRAAIDGDIEALHAIGQSAGRPPLIADVPIDEPPPYMPPPMSSSANALIPDTPLVDFPAASAFDDDAPLWQS